MNIMIASEQKAYWLVFLFLLIGLSSLAQQEKMFVYRSGMVIFEKDVTEIDSVTFNKTSTPPPLVTGTLTFTTVQGCNVCDAPTAATTVAQLESMAGGITISDACTAKDLLKVSYTDVVSGSCPVRIARNYTVKGACNNSVMIVHMITIQDTRPPVITGTLTGTTIQGCIAVAAPAAAVSVAQLESMAGGITINDACTAKDLLTVSSVDAVSGSCPITVTRTYTVKDACNNNATIVHVITVQDTTPPLVTGTLTDTTIQGCPDASAPAPATTVAALELMSGSITINDVCTAKSYLTVSSADVVKVSCPITVTRTYSIKDACNNDVRIVHVITIQRTTIPINQVSIPEGTFIMGSPITEADRYENENQHEVKLSAFKMSTYEITNTQYAEFLNAKSIGSDGLYNAGIYPTQRLINASSGSYDFGLHYSGGQWVPVSGCENHPVINVTWYGATEFATYAGGRLPTESEWEYACRAGSTTPFNTGSCLSDLQARYDWIYPYKFCSNSKTDIWRTDVVGSFPPNAWGLHDMHGNVWEWCSDWFGTYPTSVQTNPTGAATGTYRVPRGGGISNVAYRCRSANRGIYTPDYSSITIGIRLVFP